MASISEGPTRRQFAGAAAAVLGGMGLPLAVGAQESAEAGLRSEFLMDLTLDVGPAQDLGTRRIVPVLGGTFAGPKLKGTALAGGGDWILRRPDGVNELNVRTTLKTDDDQLIYLSYRGILYTPQGAPATSQYWRTTPVFETAAAKYEWLTRIIAVGVGLRVPGKAAYRVFEIL
jgi:hypothetical protein